MPAGGTFTEMNSHSGINEGECEEALTSCLNRKLLQVIDGAALDHLHRFVEQERLIGPVYGFPQEGDVDFTPTGAHTYRNLRTELYGADWGAHQEYPRIDSDGQEVFFRTAEGGMKFLQAQPQRLWLTNPPALLPVGPWCVYWWEQYPSGYRINLPAESGDSKER
jgi:hypothetical protein